jgi:hypothetical protein
MKKINDEKEAALQPVLTTGTIAKICGIKR